MAETDATGDVVANRPTEVTTPVDSVDALVESAPDPVDKGGKIYAVQYPTDRFVMEGMPVMDTTGVRLSAEQAKTLLPAAEASGVTIVEVSE